VVPAQVRDGASDAEWRKHKLDVPNDASLDLITPL
jgi:hypothetical protein